MSYAPDTINQEHPNFPARQTLPALSAVTLAALLGLALAVTANLLGVWLLHGTFVPEFFFIIIPALFMAALVARRARWASAMGAGIALLTAVLFLTDPNGQYALSHPGNSFIDFIAEVIVLAIALVVVVSGARATIQNYQGGLPSRQRWLQPFLVGLAGIVVGMSIVAALVAANPATTITSSAGGESTVHMTASNFAQNVVLVQKGSRLLIINDTSVQHILQNGTWTPNGAPDTLVEPGAPLVHNVAIAGGSVQIGPFTTAGIFHIYCSVHQGMNLTIVVQ